MAIPTITDFDTNEEVDDKDTGKVITGTNFEAVQGTGAVEISDHPDYASGTKVAQTETAWGDTSITITVALGALDPGAGLWLWVTNDTGDRNVIPFEITVHRAIAIRFVAVDGIDPGATDETAIGGGNMTPPSGKSDLSSPTGNFAQGWRSDDTNPLPAAPDNIIADDYRIDTIAWELTEDAVVGEQYELRMIFDGGDVVIPTPTNLPVVTVVDRMTREVNPEKAEQALNRAHNL